MNRTVPLAFALLGVVLGAVGQLQAVAPALVPDPTPGSPSTVVILFGSVTFLLSTVGVALVGHWASGNVDLPAEFARFAATAGVAGGLGYLLGSAVVFAVAPISMDGFLAAVLFGLGYNAATKGVSIGLYGLAGAAIAHFRTAA